MPAAVVMRVVPGVALEGGVLVVVAVLRTPLVFFAAVFAVAAPAWAIFAGVVSEVRLPTLEAGKVAGGLGASSWWTTSKLSASDIAWPSRDGEV